MPDSSVWRKNDDGAVHHVRDRIASRTGKEIQLLHGPRVPGEECQGPHDGRHRDEQGRRRTHDPRRAHPGGSGQRQIPRSAAGLLRHVRPGHRRRPRAAHAAHPHAPGTPAARPGRDPTPMDRPAGTARPPLQRAGPAAGRDRGQARRQHLRGNPDHPRRQKPHQGLNHRPAARKGPGRKCVRYPGESAAILVRVPRAAMETATLTPSLEVSYPPELPVSQRKDEIAAAIRDHQVVIVAGETGSGKTTQLPKICLELGRGVTGQIGHTQPRRIAARTVAERIAEELGTEIGTAVGYKVRFTDKSSDGTRIKVMTDGILLAEMQRDRQLRRYDTLIIDEAHERSLNIDFILGYLKRLLPARPDLKVIITSATIDPERFSKHFGAPVVEVSGRTYPVEVRYRPLSDPDRPGDEAKDQVQGICDALAELRAEGPGDVLVFLSGEREIRDTADALADRPDLGDLEVLPLYARLSAAEQHRVFQPHRRPRVVLATNVAETSLTVPGIKYVI